MVVCKRSLGEQSRHYLSIRLSLIVTITLFIWCELNSRPIEVGVAHIDITPEFPIRLPGFPTPERADEISEISQHLFAKALAIGSDGEISALLLSVDLIGVSDKMRADLAKRLERNFSGFDHSRLTLTATHNHSGPEIKTVLPFIFAEEATNDQAAHAELYSSWLMEQLEFVTAEAIKSMSPSNISFTRGSAAISVNRRMLEDNTWVGFGMNEDGPVDHDLPLLLVTDPDGSLKVVWVNYACHGVCWREPSIHGDWMGVAQAQIERDHPGIIAMITIGCAGDQAPIDVRNHKTEEHGLAIASEVKRLLVESKFQKLVTLPEVSFRQFTLPLSDLPDRSHWVEREDRYAKVVRTILERNQSLPATIPYSIQTWIFGEDLAMVFLAGEVVVDYGLRLKSELDADRLWVTAYANAISAYIPSVRLLKEGVRSGSITPLLRSAGSYGSNC